MFARNVAIHLKPNTLAEFKLVFDKEILPILRKQTGFRNHLFPPDRDRCDCNQSLGHQRARGSIQRDWIPRGTQEPK